MPRRTTRNTASGSSPKALDITPAKRKVKPRKTTKPAKAQPAPVFPMGRLPAEIQHKIWGFVFDRPACHTFKLQKRYGSRLVMGSWDLVIKPQRKNSDHSTYHLWKRLHSLKNISFETAFRYYTNNIRPIELELGSGIVRPAAAMDAATDLIIFDFHRGIGEVAFDWHEHGDLLDILSVRDKFRGIKKVAIHYKDTHPSCEELCPFMCLCPTGVLGCRKLSHCPFEVACFLDIFPDLEEFYVVVEQRLAAEKRFAAAYRPLALKCNLEWDYRTNEGGQEIGKTYNLACFFDLRFEYLQHVPNEYAPTVAASSPFACGEAYKLLKKAKSVYMEEFLDEPFEDPLEKRQQVKFGILIMYETKK